MKSKNEKSSPRPIASRPPQRTKLKSTLNRDTKAVKQEKKAQPAIAETVQETSPQQIGSSSDNNDDSLPLQQKITPEQPSKPPYTIPENNQEPNIVYFDLKARSYVAALSTADEALLKYNSNTPESVVVESQQEQQHQYSRDSAKQKNGLSFIHRSVQTNHWPTKERNVSTGSKLLMDASTSCSAWEMHDAYRSTSTQIQPPTESSMKCMLQSSKVVERMLFQNINKDILVDFKYWDDPADLARPDEGTLLPLWTFYPETAHSRSVTALAWNPKHPDLLAIAYGSFTTNQHISGLLCLYSLSNPHTPESLITLPSGILSLDFHPRTPYILALGCQNGSVHIVNAATSTILASCSPIECHADAVWQVKWIVGSSSMTVYHAWHCMSISSDGYLVHWEIYSGTEIRRTSVLSLHPAQNESSTSLSSSSSLTSSSSSLLWQSHASASCFDVHPFHPSIVLIGTHEGNVLRCSTDSGSRSIEMYHIGSNTHYNGNSNSNGSGSGSDSVGRHDITSTTTRTNNHHHQQQQQQQSTNNTTTTTTTSTTTTTTIATTNNSTDTAFPIYSVAWNPLHPSSFLTASFDWNIRIWDSLSPDEEIFHFDVGSPIADAAWSPWSATTFAAATEAGKVVVYDLSHNTEFPLCKQKVAHKTKLTKIAFNPVHPIVVVGDEKGRVTCFKLSPNLRKQQCHNNCDTNNGSSNNGSNNTNMVSMHEVLKVGALKRMAEKMGYTILSSSSSSSSTR